VVVRTLVDNNSTVARTAYATPDNSIYLKEGKLYKNFSDINRGDEEIEIPANHSVHGVIDDQLTFYGEATIDNSQKSFVALKKRWGGYCYIYLSNGTGVFGGEAMSEPDCYRLKIRTAQGQMLFLEIELQ
jgi:hypothetical protein